MKTLLILVMTLSVVWMASAHAVSPPHAWVLIPAGEFIMGSSAADVDLGTVLCETDCTTKTGDFMGDVEALSFGDSSDDSPFSIVAWVRPENLSNALRQ